MLLALGASAHADTAGRVFKDCADCPDMVVIPDGSFQMGSKTGEKNEAPVRSVHFDRAFAIGRTELTHCQWRAVMGSDPPKLNFRGCDDCPVERVNWHDAGEFLCKLREKTGKYYRLPTEAEWEYTCRAGGTLAYYGNDSVDGVAWHKGNSGGKTHPAASKQANAWRLYEMSGNVHEWMEDCWYDNYKDAPTDGRARTGAKCAERVVARWLEPECHYVNS